MIISLNNKIENYLPSLKWMVFLLLVFGGHSKLNAQADFSASPLKGCTPLTVAFTDLSTNAASWNWDLGNGNTSTLQNPSAIYYNPGKYTVKLTIIDKSGKTYSITKSQYVRAFKSPKANFSANPLTICLGEKITFTENSSIGDTNIVKYSWDMGDGTVLSTKSPIHQFGASGKYSVSLVVTDANGCQDKIQKIQIVTVNPKPTALFKMDSAYDCKVPTFIPFRNASVGNGLSYRWDFGDGAGSTATNPRHQYTKLGTYSPKLVVVDVNGCKDSLTLKNGLYLGPLNPDFTSDITTVCGASVIDFENKTVFNGGLKFSWDFGDGTTSSNPYPSKYYKNPGKYTVSLTVQSVFRSCSATVTKNNYITIYPKPKGKIVLSDSFPCKPPYSFTAKYEDTGKIASIQWYLEEYGRGRYKNGTANPQSFTIFNNSAYKIIAIVTNQYGCTDSFIYDLLQSSITNLEIDGNFTGCVPLIFKGQSTIASNRKITGVVWEFYDGDEYTTPTVTKLFNDTGIFNGSVTAFVYKNCFVKLDFKIHVGQKVEPKFYTEPVGEICNNSSGIYFINATQYPGFTVDSFRWIFNDEESRNSQLKIRPWMPLPKPYAKTNTWHYYDRDTGWLRPALVSYHHGCPDTATQIDSIKIKAAFAIIQLDYDICKKSNLIVRNVSTKYTQWYWQIDNKLYYTDTVVLDPLVVHTIMLKIWDDSSGCWDTATRIFFPVGPNIGTVNVLEQELCSPGYVVLEAQHSGQSLIWTINGKDTALDIDVVKFRFDTAGIYNIETNFKFSKYCDKTIKNQFIVGESNLKGSVVQPKSCLPAEITLYDSSFRPGIKHAWVLSNGDTIKVKDYNSKHTIYNSFKDTIWARLISDGSNVICEPSTVIPISVVGPGFRPRLIWQHTCSTSILKGYLDKKRLTANYTYQWEMGDGKKYTTQNITHQFVDSGYYTIKITVTDLNGCAATESLKVYFPGQRLKVRVSFTTVGTKCPPLLAHFRDTSISGTVSITKWLWDFGDGSSSVLQHPSHQYVNPGKYSIRLTITDSLGCSASRVFLYLILVPGPDGKFNFTPKTGCLPLNVIFTDSVNNQTKSKEWDFGDGVVLKGNLKSHIYDRPGRYIPAVILEDSFGCKRTIRPKDTIYVFDNPKADFNFDGQCLRDSIKFVSTSTCSDAIIQSYQWKFTPENQADTGKEVLHLFKTSKNKVELIVKSKNSCLDTFVNVFHVFEPSAEILNLKNVICLGQTWNGDVKVLSDTTINKSYWSIDGAQFSNNKLFDFKPSISKIYKIQYYVEDILGCWDTSIVGISLKVGDTIVPQEPTWRRVSVLNDISHELVWKKYPSFDFKDYVIYQDNGAGFAKINSLSNIGDTVFNVIGVDALHKSYCYKIGTTNLCDYTQKESVLKNHCTIELSGKSGLNLSQIQWNAYVGWPVERYLIYRQIDNGPFDSIGQVDGSVLKYTDTNIRCYKVHHYLVKAIEKNGLKEFSWSDTCHVKPMYLNRVNPPEMRRATVLNDQYVRVEWQQLLKNKIPLERFVMVGNTLNGSNNFQKWVINANSDSLVVADKSIDVDQTSSVYKVLGIDECGDSSVFSTISKSILLNVQLNANYFPALSWNKYLDWKEGVKEYLVERNMGQGFALVDRLSPFDTTYTDELPSLNCMPKLDYRITAIRNKVYGLDSSWYFNSVSNIQNPGVETKVFIPNAFTPNKNDLNEIFKPQGIYIFNYSMRIFNRWGEKLFDSEGCDIGWDGKYKGMIAPEGVYIYQVNVKGTDGRLYPFSGDVTLLR